MVVETRSDASVTAHWRAMWSQRGLWGVESPFNTQHIRQNRHLRYFPKVVMPRNLDIFSGRFCQEWSYGATKWAIEMLRETVSMTQSTTKTHFLWSPSGSHTHIKHICLYGLRFRFLKRSILSMTAELKTHFQSAETGVLPSQHSQ